MPKYLLSTALAICAAGIIFYLFFRSERASAPREAMYEGHTMHQWLQILSDNTNFAGTSLNDAKIIDSQSDDSLEYVEVPLRYDLLATNGFFDVDEKKGWFDIEIKGSGGYLPKYDRATNGNCLLGFDKDQLTFGTNFIQAIFYIHNPSHLSFPLRAKSPALPIIYKRLLRTNPKIINTVDGGFIFWADLSCLNADYQIEFANTNGIRIQTLSGHSTDGTISQKLDLLPRPIEMTCRIVVSNLSETVTQTIESPSR